MRLHKCAGYDESVGQDPTLATFLCQCVCGSTRVFTTRAFQYLTKMRIPETDPRLAMWYGYVQWLQRSRSRSICLELEDEKMLVAVILKYWLGEIEMVTLRCSFTWIVMKLRLCLRFFSLVQDSMYLNVPAESFL